MFKIIKLNKKHKKILAEIDLESKHQMESNLKLSDYGLMLKKRFHEGYELFFGFKEENIIKGYITLKPFFPGYKHCEIYWLSVRDKFQCQGIGKRLIIFIEGYAKRKGFRKICIYTNKTMTKTRKFYEKCGYKFINEFPDYYEYKEDNTAVLYSKSI